MDRNHGCLGWSFWWLFHKDDGFPRGCGGWKLGDDGLALEKNGSIHWDIARYKTQRFTRPSSRVGSDDREGNHDVPAAVLFHASYLPSTRPWKALGLLVMEEDIYWTLAGARDFTVDRLGDRGGIEAVVRDFLVERWLVTGEQISTSPLFHPGRIMTGSMGFCRPMIRHSLARDLCLRCPNLTSFGICTHSSRACCRHSA